MRRNAAPADLQRWSEEVARDAGAPSFVPLADAYRRQGKHDAALRLCLRGLERNPTNVEAHTLLARLYLESNDRERAHDEWAVVLRLDPDNFDAHRGIGFVHLERGDHGTARRHLERAAAVRPGDPAVQEALLVLEERAPGAQPDASAAPVQAAAPSAAEPRAAPARGQAVVDPRKLFEPLRREAPFLGAVILDARGLVLAGGLADRSAGADAEALAAILSGAIEEAVRTTELLKLGSWRGMLLDSEAAQVHITSLGEDLMVLIAARTGAPAGWVVRTAERAAELSRAFLQGAST